jgi:helix-turn-helix protein
VDLNGKEGDGDELREYLNSQPGEEKFILTTRKRWVVFLQNDAERGSLLGDIKMYERLSREVGDKELILLATTPGK